MLSCALFVCYYFCLVIYFKKIDKFEWATSYTKLYLHFRGLAREVSEANVSSNETMLPARNK